LGTPTFSNSVYATDPSYYSSFQFADVTGDGLPDLCFKDHITPANGVTCIPATLGPTTGMVSGWSYNNTSALWTIPAFSNPFTSLQFIDANSDGKPDACGRFSDGVHCYSNTGGSGTGFSSNPILLGPFSDTWVSQQTYDSDASQVTFLDLNNDGYVDACARGITGLQCFLNNKNGGFNSGYVLGGLSNSTTLQIYLIGSGDPSGPLQTYSTLRYADINGDGYVDVCAFLLGGDYTYANGTLTQYCWLNNKDGTFSGAVSTGIQYGPGLTNLPLGTADSWGNKPFNIQPTYVDLDSDGHPDYCLRTTGGMECWINHGAASGGVSFARTTIPGLTGAFPSGSGWDAPQYSSTIQFLDFNGDSRPDICARAAAGMMCALNKPASASQVFNFQWLTTSNSNFINQYPDANGYTAANLYSTFRFFGLANGRTAFFTLTPGGAAQVYYPANNQDTGSAVDLLTGISTGGTAATSVSIIYNNGAMSIPGSSAVFYQKGNFGGLSGLSNTSSSTQSAATTLNTAPITSSPVLPTYDVPAPLPLVYQINSYDPATSTNNTTAYNYGGLVAQFRRGLLGFRYVRSMPYGYAGTWTESAYRLDWPFTGLPDTVSRGNTYQTAWPTGVQSATSNNNWLNQAQYYYLAQDLLNNLNNQADTAPSSSCQTAPYQLAPYHLSQQLKNANYLIYPYRVIENTRSLNNFNSLSTVTTDTVTETTQGNTTCVDVNTVDNLKGILWDKVTKNTYDTSSQWTSSGNWILGRLTQSQVTSTSPTPYSFYFTPALGSSQGGYTPVAYSPNTNDGSLGPVHPEIMPWFIPVMSLIMQ